mgnify:CR=1 FL=1
MTFVDVEGITMILQEDDGKKQFWETENKNFAIWIDGSYYRKNSVIGDLGRLRLNFINSHSFVFSIE